MHVALIGVLSCAFDYVRLMLSYAESSTTWTVSQSLVVRVTETQVSQGALLLPTLLNDYRYVQVPCYPRRISIGRL